eukprot:4803366-Prymnesium_polylepis.1
MSRVLVCDLRWKKKRKKHTGAGCTQLPRVGVQGSGLLRSLPDSGRSLSCVRPLLAAWDRAVCNWRHGRKAVGPRHAARLDEEESGLSGAVASPAVVLEDGQAAYGWWLRPAESQSFGRQGCDGVGVVGSMQWRLCGVGDEQWKHDGVGLLCIEVSNSAAEAAWARLALGGLSIRMARSRGWGERRAGVHEAGTLPGVPRATVAQAAIASENIAEELDSRKDRQPQQPAYDLPNQAE